VYRAINDEGVPESIRLPDTGLGFTEPGEYLSCVIENACVGSEDFEFDLKNMVSVQDVGDKLPGGWLLSDRFGMLALHPDLNVTFLNLKSRDTEKLYN